MATEELPPTSNWSFGDQIIDLYQVLFDARHTRDTVPTIDTMVHVTLDTLLTADPLLAWPEVRDRLGTVAFETFVSQQAIAEQADRLAKLRQNARGRLIELFESSQGAQFIVTSVDSAKANIAVKKGHKTTTIVDAASGFINSRTIDAFREQPERIRLGLLRKGSPTDGHLSVQVINVLTEKPAIGLHLNP